MMNQKILKFEKYCKYIIKNKDYNEFYKKVMEIYLDFI